MPFEKQTDRRINRQDKSFYLRAYKSLKWQKPKILTLQSCFIASSFSNVIFKGRTSSHDDGFYNLVQWNTDHLSIMVTSYNFLFINYTLYNLTSCFKPEKYGRRTDGRCAMTIHVAHSILQLRWAKMRWCHEFINQRCHSHRMRACRKLKLKGALLVW